MAAAPRKAPASTAVATAAALRFPLPWYAPCARCGHRANYGEMIHDGAGTGPWLCSASTFLGRGGCRRTVLDVARRAS